MPRRRLVERETDRQGQTIKIDTVTDTEAETETETETETTN